MAKLINGIHYAQEFRERLKRLCDHLILEHSLVPGLAVIQVGDHAPSTLYVEKKHEAAEAMGFHFLRHHLPGDVKEGELKALIEHLNHDPKIHGILLQLPLPGHLDARRFIETIAPHKDVDGLHPYNAGLLEQNIDHGMVACTPLGCSILLHKVHEKLAGLNAVVIGKSNLVGRPMASILLNQQMTVTVTHKLTRNLPDLCRHADILVVAAGSPELVKKEWVKPGATVIDVGINRLDDGRVVGDVDFDGVSQVAGAITPVPGGVGPMTVACLLHNTLKAAYLSHGLPFYEM